MPRILCLPDCRLCALVTVAMCRQGDNAWLFVGEECISESVKAFLDFEKKLKDRLPKEQRAKAKPTDVSGGAMDGKALSYADVQKLKSLPTKLELIATIARLIKQVRIAGTLVHRRSTRCDMPSSWLRLSFCALAVSSTWTTPVSL